MFLPRSFRLLATAAAFSLLASPLSALAADHAHAPANTADHDSAKAVDLQGVRQVFGQNISNIPGKSLFAFEVNYAPGQSSESHRHADTAFILAYVVSGKIRSQVDDQPPQVYEAGQTWFEKPGAHHVLSENASDTEPAKLLAIFVVDTDDPSELTRFDK